MEGNDLRPIRVIDKGGELHPEILRRPGGGVRQAEMGRRHPSCPSELPSDPAGENFP